MSDEQTPGVWELSRRIDAMQQLVDGRVTKDVFEGYRGTQTDRLRDMQGQIDRLDAVIEDMRKTRAAQWFSIGLAVLTALSGVVLALVNHALG